MVICYVNTPSIATSPWWHPLCYKLLQTFCVHNRAICYLLLRYHVLFTYVSVITTNTAISHRTSHSARCRRTGLPRCCRWERRRSCCIPGWSSDRSWSEHSRTKRRRRHKPRPPRTPPRPRLSAASPASWRWNCPLPPPRRLQPQTQPSRKVHKEQLSRRPQCPPQHNQGNTCFVCRSVDYDPIDSALNNCGIPKFTMVSKHGSKV